MGYYLYKMFFRLVVCLTLLRSACCYPQTYRFPDLDVSTPEEVNSLERDEPVARSIKPARTNSIEDTVKEVENIIRANPALPRLTRGEILDLLENITVTDLLRSRPVNKSRDPKAIMVVMPYTPSNDKNMEDLYTKAPVTHIIGGGVETTKPKHSRRRPPVKFNDTDNDLAKKPLPNDERKKYSATVEQKSKPTVPPRSQLRRRRPEPTMRREVPTVPTTKPTTQSTTKPTTATTYHPKTRRPIRRRPSTTTTTPPSIEFLPYDGIKIIQSPNLLPPQFDDLILEENVKHEVTEVAPSSPKPLSEEMHLPDHLKHLMKDLNVESALNPPKVTLEEQNRIKSMLASIGALPDTTTTSTTTRMPDAAVVADALSPDMRDLLMSFGLLPNPEPKTVSSDPGKYYPEKAEVSAESYVGFKPLPDDGPSRDDMDALLASFGLGRSARKGKSIAKNVTQTGSRYNIDMVPEHLKGIVLDLGLPTTKKEKTVDDESTVVTQQHVFNPDQQQATAEELKKLEKLMGMIRMLEAMNGTATEEDLKKIDMESLNEVVASLNGQNETSMLTLDQIDNSPDPNDFDVGLVKNEVKRQESTTASSSTTTATITTTESSTPSIKDLEASFGGETETVTEPEHETTTHIHTGVYYLVDWNTFLDIDDTKGRRVNLRFQPKVGDPKKWYSVTVP